jgi:hypothetical protein
MSSHGCISMETYPSRPATPQTRPAVSDLAVFLVNYPSRTAIQKQLGRHIVVVAERPLSSCHCDFSQSQCGRLKTRSLREAPHRCAASCVKLQLFIVKSHGLGETSWPLLRYVHIRDEILIGPRCQPSCSSDFRLQL